MKKMLIIVCAMVIALYSNGQVNNRLTKLNASDRNQKQFSNAINRDGIIFYEDFANGLQGNNGFGSWTSEAFVDNTIQYPIAPPEWQFDTDGPNGFFSAASEIIESPTQNNGFMIFDADKWHTPSMRIDNNIPGNDKIIRVGASLVSPKINLSLVSDVNISFYQSIRYCCETNHQLSVDISIDGGLTYIKSFPVKLGNFNSLKKEKTTINITPYVAFQTNVVFKFVWGNGTASHYHWQIDDVTLEESPLLDLAINQVYVQTSSQNNYLQIPKNLTQDTIKSLAIVRNLSNETKSVKLVSYTQKNGSTDTLMSNIATQIAAHSIDTVEGFFTIEPCISAVYEPTFEVIAENLDNVSDQTPSNNVLTTKIEVTDNIISFNSDEEVSSSVIDNYFGSLFSSGQNLYPTIFYTNFKAYENLELDSVSIAISNATLGSKIQWAIFKKPLDENDMYNSFFNNPLAFGANYTIQNNILVNNGLDQNMINNEKTYLTFFDTTYNQTTNQLMLTNKSITLPGNSEGIEYVFGIYTPNDDYFSCKCSDYYNYGYEYYMTGRSIENDSAKSTPAWCPMLFDMHIKPEECTDNLNAIKESKDLVLFSLNQNYPNPVYDETTINFVLNKTNADVEFELIDIGGRQVFYNNMGSMSAGSHDVKLNLTSITNGIYYYRLKVDNQVITKKLLLAK